MKMLKGKKTLIIAVLSFVLGGFEAVQDSPVLPPWVFQQLVPALMFVMRFVSDTPVLKAKNESTFKTNQSNLGDRRR